MTTSYALVAPLRIGEDAKRWVRQLGIGRTDLKIGRREGHILIPLENPIEAPLAGTSIEVAEFASTKPPRSYKDVVQVPERVRPDLPTSFDIIGDLVLIKVPDAMRVFGPAIGDAILRVHKNVKGVFHDEGVQGEFRVRSLHPLAGVTRTTTAHAEYGVRFEVDLTKAYFSPRLANEHDRLAKLVQAGEVVVDATAGVGPFAVLIARQRRAAKVFAVDLNPDAVQLLRHNLKIHHVDDRVEVHQGDAAAFVKTLAPFDRAIVNLPHGGEAILFACARACKPGGVLHYYRIFDSSTADAAMRELAARVAKESAREASITEAHVVHAYSPTDRLYGVQLRIG